MSTCLQILCLGLGLLLSSLGALAQNTTPPEPPAVTVPELVAAPTPEPPAATVSQRAQQQAAYLTDALRLKARQTAALRAALQVRFDAAEVLSHLLFASASVATAAFDAIDYRYYIAMNKVLTPNQFHKLLQFNGQVTGEVVTPLVLR